MGDYIWKINMIDGKSYDVYTDENDLRKFVLGIIPNESQGEKISFFKCVEEHCNTKNRIFNSVVILGSKVSSVEYYIKR